MATVKKTTEKATKAPAVKKAELADPAVKAVKKSAASAAKTAKKAAAPAVKTILQANGREFDLTALNAKVLEAAKSHHTADIAELAIYVKPDEAVAYYTIDGEGCDAYMVEL